MTAPRSKAPLAAGFVCELCGQPIDGLTAWAGQPGGVAPRHDRGLCPDLPVFHETRSAGRWLVLVTYFDTPTVAVEGRVLFRTAEQAKRAAELLRALRYGSTKGVESDG